jgi:hypothetical protein
MPRYQKVNYQQVSSMIRIVVAMRGEPLPLREVVRDMSKKLSLGIDTHRVMQVLGDKVVEKVEQDGEVRRVTTWVIP